MGEYSTEYVFGKKITSPQKEKKLLPAECVSL
jgi:hypothetical protein